MKKLVSIMITVFLLVNCYAESEVRTIKDFSELSISNAFEVIITQGDKNEVKISSEKSEDIEKVITKVSGKKLSISLKKNSKNVGELKLYITFKKLDGIDLSGAVELKGTNTITANKFYLKGRGATELSLDLEVEDLTVDFSGASELRLKGSTNSFSISLSGASELSASGLKSKNATISVAGASEVHLNVTETVSGSVSGASEIKVNGGASVENIKSSGLSSISKG